MSIFRTPVFSGHQPTGYRQFKTTPVVDWSLKLLLIILITLSFTDTAEASSPGDLALGKIVYVSSKEKDINYFSPSHVVDGNSSTRWASKRTDDEWVVVDLGAVYPIDRVVLNWETAYGKAYLIRVSNDAENWTTVFSETNGNGGIDDISFPNANGRYVLMHGSQRGTSFGYSLYDFEVYGGTSDPPVLTTISVSPATTAVTLGNTQAFTATGLDQFDNPIATTVNWTVTAGSGDGTIGASNGLFYASATGTVTVTATDTTDNSITGGANVTVVDTPVLTTISVSPATTTVTVGNTQAFTATGLDQFDNPIATTVNWTVTAGSGDGTIGAGTGLFYATVAGTVTVTATDTTDNSITGGANVTVVDTPPAPQGDLALGKTVYVSSKEKDINYFSPSHIVDGNSSTRWASRHTDDEWVVVDLGAVYPIDRVVLNWETAYGKAYLIRVSNDAENWTTVFSETNGNGGIDDISFPTANGRYVLMHGSQRGTSFGYSLYDFEVYGGTSDPPVLTTISVSPATTAVTLGNTQAFTATGLDQFDNPIATTVNWTVTAGSGDGTIGASNGLFYASATGTVTVTATDTTDNSITGGANVTVVDTPVLTTISVSPATTTVTVGNTQAFTATGLDQFDNPIATTVNWTVTAGSGDGTIGAGTGLFHATVAGTVTVTATDTTDNSITGGANVTVVDTPPAPQGDLALGKTVYVSSKEKDINYFSPSHIVDGNSSTRWASRHTDDEWVVVDLGAVYPIDRVVLNWETAYGKAYLIRVSNDAENWTTVFSETNGNGGIDDISFPTANGRYVLMHGSQRGTSFGYSLYDFEVYGGSGGTTCTNLPVSYDFTNGDVSTWSNISDTPTSSTWQVISGEYHQSTDVFTRATGYEQSYKLGSYSYIPSLGCLSNYKFSVDITPLKDVLPPFAGADGKDVGIMFRYQDNDNYYRLSFNARNSYARLEKKAGGDFTTLATNARGYIEEQAFNVTINVDGDLIQISVDGDPLFAASDPDHASGTIALYSQDAVKFDNVHININTPGPTLVLSAPLAHSVGVGAAVTASAVVTNFPTGGSVAFELGGAPCGPATEVSPGLFTADCGNPGQGEYFLPGMGLRGILRNSSGGIVASDENSRIGVQGDSYVTVGDSITEGAFDFFSPDNQSLDSRMIGKQGYQARLSDLLTTSTLTNIVFNEGVAGDKTHNTLPRIDSIMERYSGSNRVLMMLGTNDSAGGTPLSQSAYQANMQSLANAINGQSKSAWVALVPPVLPYAENLTRNGDIKGYNAAINNLANIQIGPDFFSFFYDDNKTTAPNETDDDNERISLFYDTVHPNALGIRIMGDLWANTLSGNTTPPFFLDRLCNRLVSTDCSAVSPTNHKQNLLEVGNEYYIDEAYTLTSIPAPLADGIWILPSNGESNNTAANYLEFTVDRPVTVFVAFDAGATPPIWLSGSFDDEFIEVHTTDPASPILHIYSQAFSADPDSDEEIYSISLGGNMATGAIGADSNYLAIIVE